MYRRKKRGEKKSVRSKFQGIIKNQKAEFLPYWIVFAQEHSSPKANPETVVSLWHMTCILRVYSRLQQTEMTFRQLKPHPLSYVKILCLVGMLCCWVAECIITVRDGKDLCGLCAWNKKMLQLTGWALLCLLSFVSPGFLCVHISAKCKNRDSFIATFHRVFPA